MHSSSPAVDLASLVDLARRDYPQAVELAGCLWQGAPLMDATFALWEAHCGAEQVSLPLLPAQT